MGSLVRRGGTSLTTWPEAPRFRNLIAIYVAGGLVDPIVLKIEGMTCSHCVRAVKGALESVPGVSTVEVSLEKGTAEILGSPDVSGLLNAITGEGYVAAPLK
jgi:copper chaperone